MRVLFIGKYYCCCGISQLFSTTHDIYCPPPQFYRHSPLNDSPQKNRHSWQVNNNNNSTTITNQIDTVSVKPNSTVCLCRYIRTAIEPIDQPTTSTHHSTTHTWHVKLNYLPHADDMWLLLLKWNVCVFMCVNSCELCFVFHCLFHCGWDRQKKKHWHAEQITEI